MRVPTPCLDCGTLTVQGVRCPLCRHRADRIRNNAPHRRLYRDPAYASLVPTGLCHWGCGRPATERDHVIPISKGGTNDRSNIVFACRPCNAGRGNRSDVCREGHDKNVVGRTKDGRCRPCTTERHAAWRAANPDRWRDIQQRSRQRRNPALRMGHASTTEVHVLSRGL